MKERPILFSAPMVRALLDGSKTQTRRVAIKTSQPRAVYISDFDATECKIEIENKHSGERYWKSCPYGQPGDRLWVRETFSAMGDKTRHAHPIFYRADRPNDTGRWTPSIHMPRWASRINLEIVGVRVEQLQSISEADARAEGCCALTLSNPPTYESAVDTYRFLWDAINGAGSWATNPWVWVVEFKRVQP